MKAPEYFLFTFITATWNWYRIFAELWLKFSSLQNSFKKLVIHPIEGFELI